MFLKLPYVHMLIKQKSPPLPRNTVLWAFGELVIVFSTDVNLLYILYLTAWRHCFLDLIKQNGLLKTFRRSLISMTWISLYLFLLLKLHNISVTPKIVNCSDCIPVVFLKNCEPELSYILAELFSKCLKECCFPHCWKISLVVPVFKNVGERSTAKKTALLFLFLWLVKLFEKVVNNRIVDH